MPTRRMAIIPAREFIGVASIGLERCIAARQYDMSELPGIALAVWRTGALRRRRESADGENGTIRQAGSTECRNCTPVGLVDPAVPIRMRGQLPEAYPLGCNGPEPGG